MDLDRWCREQLGSGVAVVRWYREGTGLVWGVDLQDGRAVVVKAHRRGYLPDEHLAAFVVVQRRVADRYPWAPMPLAGPAPLGDRVATAEELLAEGVPASDPATMASALQALVTAAGEPPPGLFALWSFPTLWPPPHQEHIDLRAPAASGSTGSPPMPGARMRDAPRRAGRRPCRLALRARPRRSGHERPPRRARLGFAHRRSGGLARGCRLRLLHRRLQRRDGSPARWPSPAESAAFIAAYDPTGRLDAGQVRAAGDYHLAYIARCVHSVGGFPEVADLLAERFGSA